MLILHLFVGYLQMKAKGDLLFSLILSNCDAKNS